MITFVLKEMLIEIGMPLLTARKRTSRDQQKEEEKKVVREFCQMSADSQPTMGRAPRLIIHF